MSTSLILLLVAEVLILSSLMCAVDSIAVNGGNNIGIASFRKEYDDPIHQKPLRLQQQHRSRDDSGSNERSHDDDIDMLENFHFERYQSPISIQEALETIRGGNVKKKFKFHKGKDGRKGYVSTTKIGKSDWVLAESQQIAINCTTKDVLKAYLSGELQAKWNSDKVINCTFTKFPLSKSSSDDEDNGSCSAAVGTDDSGIGDPDNDGDHGRYYYQQDLVLHSQRVITSHTGIMRYGQSIHIDQIGHSSDKYCAHIKLIEPTAKIASSESSTDEASSSSPTSPARSSTKQSTNTIEDEAILATTKKKPFNKLQVYVNLEQHGNNVQIYAAGIMKVNRQVVPNLIIFDASGIAGTMAGKGTLWLNSYFDERQQEQEQQR